MDDLQDIIGEQLGNILIQLVQGAKEDIQKFSRDMTNDLYMAMLEPDEVKRENLRESLKNQIEMLAELNRIRGSKAMWNTIGTVTDALFEVSFRALGVPPASAQAVK